MPNPPLLQAADLSRRFGNHQAVADVSFELHRGDVLGFLGPNGAGKSTTMRMLSGNLAPHQGTVSICGHDLFDTPLAAKRELGYLPELPPLDKAARVDGYLDFCARLHGLRGSSKKQAIDQALERCGLGDVRQRVVGNLSKGFQQRVGIAQAILHSPPVIILDEPTVGLDPVQIRAIRELIVELGEQHAVVLSTHILTEVQSICSRVLMLNRGRVVFADQLDADGFPVNSNRNARLLLRSTTASAALIEAIRATPGVIDVTITESAETASRILIEHSTLPDNHARAELNSAILACLNRFDAALLELSPLRTSLEELFVSHTAGDADAGERFDTASTDREPADAT